MLSDVGRLTLAHLPHLDGKQSTQGMPPFLQEQLLHLPVLLHLKQVGIAGQMNHP